MFERYTEQARRVLFFARYECTLLGSPSIEPEHLLLGIMREHSGITQRIFTDAKVTLDVIRRELEAVLKRPEKLSESVEIPFDPGAKRVLQYAAEESSALGHNYIGPEHLLVGIVREEESLAARLLASHGIRLDELRTQMLS
jgi:ATP-dependent Clp protease ATP-binding subunit ClpC